MDIQICDNCDWKRYAECATEGTKDFVCGNPLSRFYGLNIIWDNTCEQWREMEYYTINESTRTHWTEDEKKKLKDYLRNEGINIQLKGMENENETL